jgi:tryptophanyl-tRNA synthetase
MANKNEIDAALKIGADKARMIAQETLKRVRSKVGY